MPYIRGFTVGKSCLNTFSFVEIFWSDVTINLLYLMQICNLFLITGSYEMEIHHQFSHGLISSWAVCPDTLGWYRSVLLSIQMNPNHHNSNFMEISFWPNPNSGKTIAMDICRWHKRCPVLSCRNMFSDAEIAIPFSDISSLYFVMKGRQCN